MNERIVINIFPPPLLDYGEPVLASSFRPHYRHYIGGYFPSLFRPFLAYFCPPCPLEVMPQGIFMYPQLFSIAPYPFLFYSFL